ncbi:MAG: hypothetical protein WCA13_08000 [Terriglobales bacterium]
MIAIKCTMYFAGTKRPGLKHSHGSLSVGKLPDKSRQNASGWDDCAEV